MKTANPKPKPLSRTSPRGTSAKDILGNNKRPRVVAQYQTEPEVCYVCLNRLTAQRLAALRDLGTPLDSWMCVPCSSSVTSPRLGIYMGEVGTSELKIVDKIYNDSVRDIFMEGGETEDNEEKDEKE